MSKSRDALLITGAGDYLAGTRWGQRLDDAA